MVPILGLIVMKLIKYVSYITILYHINEINHLFMLILNIFTLNVNIVFNLLYFLLHLFYPPIKISDPSIAPLFHLRSIPMLHCNICFSIQDWKTCYIHCFFYFIPPIVVDCVFIVLNLLGSNCDSFIMFLTSEIKTAFAKPKFLYTFCLLWLPVLFTLYTSITWADAPSNLSLCLTRFQEVKPTQYLSTPSVTQ